MYALQAYQKQIIQIYLMFTNRKQPLNFLKYI